MSLSEYKKARTKLPPSYERFVNTIRPDQQSPTVAFNSAFVPDTESDFSWLVTSQDVQPGQEILVDYGKQYPITPTPKTNKLSQPQTGKYYAVRKGNIPGIYTTWAEAEAQVHKFKQAEQRLFFVRAAAESYLSFLPTSHPSSPPPSLPPSCRWSHVTHP